MDALTLTPTQDLMMEVLAARARLGHREWEFDTRHAATAKHLETAGLVYVLSSPAPRTIKVGLTNAGRDAYISPTYTPPAPPTPATPAPAPAVTLTVLAGVDVKVVNTDGN